MTVSAYKRQQRDARALRWASDRARERAAKVLSESGDVDAAARAMAASLEANGYQVESVERTEPHRAQRRYDGASKGRRTSGWKTHNDGPNTTNRAALAMLRARVRDLVRNNPQVQRAMRIMVQNIVGTGITPQSKVVVPQNMPGINAAKLNATVEALWKQWQRHADTSSPMGVYGLQSVAARAMLQDGGVLIRRRPRRLEDGLPVPLQFQLMEVDMLADRTEDLWRKGEDGKQVRSGRIVDGVEFDALDRIAAYHLHTRHPGELTGVESYTAATVRVPASEVFHAYEALRPGQVRGVPWFAAGVIAAQEYGEFNDATRLKQKLAACIFASVEDGDESGVAGNYDGIGDTQDENGQAREDAHGNPIEMLEPGIIMHLKGGKKVHLHSPPGDPTSGQYRKDQLHDLAAAFNVTYADLSGDLSSVNYSSARFGDVRFRPLIRQLQSLFFIPMFCDPMWESFIASSIAAGLLPDGPIYLAEWMLPRFEEVDRAKEAAANYLDVRGGFNSRTAIIASAGRDPDTVRQEIAAERAADKAAGLLFDTDPANINKSGQLQGEAQANATAEPEPTDDEDGERARLAAAVSRAILNGDTDVALAHLASSGHLLAQ